MIKRDRFELLSAYLDGEVTPHERQLVNSWLAHDPSAKCLYNRLLQLRQGLKSSPVEPTYTSDETLAGVFSSLNKRFRTTCMAGAGVLAIGALGLLSGVFRPNQSWLQWASVPSDSVASGDVLQITLDEPAFPIPQDSPMSTTTEILGAEQRRLSLPTGSEL
ncbi:transcriptional regulator [Pseudanabaena sp. FACHB-2040]|uniref:anti-sigma factor family protein n=1 Tax=Pseudanabaena sp. FACHB-2040 TaxID=2692859 RepID=UPI00168A1023|nr:transcriptional regulator [Pseudanabaena sp. FACHB-2040]MBD2257450.1 transcriptional regulator [Pseudanabaena sp. FACHB-2040]